MAAVMRTEAASHHESTIDTANGIPSFGFTQEQVACVCEVLQNSGNVDWLGPDPYGRCQPVSTFTETRASWKLRPWSPSIVDTLPNFIRLSNLINFLRPTIPSYSRSGFEHTMPRRRRYVDDHLVQSENTEFVGSSLCRGQYGTDRKLLIVSKNAQDCVTGMIQILTRHREKSVSWLNLLV